DATTHIQTMVASCPNTKLVLGGYSQGASVMELSSNSMPAPVVNHVAAVVLFGPPTSGYSSSLWGGPLPVLATAYRPKSIDFCIPDDIICAEGGNMVAHLMYTQNGSPDQAATFAAGRL
ncbi:MAG: cutinase family protein, partial [Solirubrobacteraceae bacterium]